jgi:hypothetical protein
MYPKRGSAKQMTISFYDDEKRTLFRWFKDWVEIDILNAGQFISGLEDQHTSVVTTQTEKALRQVKPYRIVRLALLEAYRKEVLVYEFGVIPSGEMSWAGDQSSEANMFSVTFDIVAEGGSKDPAKTSIFQEIKNVIGRFL